MCVLTRGHRKKLIYRSPLIIFRSNTLGKGEPMKNIPIGLSSFMATKDRNYLYVDKTKEILSIIKKNRVSAKLKM